MSDTPLKPKFEVTYVSDGEGSEGMQSTGEGHIRTFSKRPDGPAEFSRWYKGKQKPELAWVETMSDYTRNLLLINCGSFYLVSRKALSRLDRDYELSKTQLVRTAAVETFDTWRNEKILALRLVIGPDDLSLEQSSRYCNWMVEFARAHIKAETIPTELEIAEAGRKATGHAYQG